ncbi:aldo/keto reductase [Deinococcus planocerae]|uniref:aldo/keto reductase n=1 Tax=Deinococcus planocerae TaxID=1737569 RepID=UPI000C7EB5E5|nr:aldo/keto reductase [Deinococcus planocerae]
MRYKLLGRSALRVSELALGTMTFGTAWGWGADVAESRRIFDAYAEAGGNFIDTANRYTEGESERFVGEFLREDRERFVLATKYTLFTRRGDPNASGNHRKNLVQALDASLKRLGTDYIDLYWLHAWDFTTPVEEVMRALDDQVRAGKILHVGVSDTPAWVVARANTLAEERGWTPFTALQVEYSLIERTVERDLLPMSRALGLAVTPWAPLAGGALTGKYTRGEGQGRLKPGQARLSERNLAVAREVDAVADELGRPSAHVALAWVRAQPGTLVPIVGATTGAQLEENLAALDLTLSPAHLARLNEVSRIDLGFPHHFLDSPGVLDVVFGGLHDRIDR